VTTKKSAVKKVTRKAAIVDLVKADMAKHGIAVTMEHDPDADAYMFHATSPMCLASFSFAMTGLQIDSLGAEAAYIVNNRILAAFN
jgi:hypothetical protein